MRAEPIQITPEQAEAYYRVLVEVAGARDTDDDRWDFMRYVTRPVADGFREWRFQGAVGFGGKFKTSRGGPPIVDCYPEHLNAARADHRDHERPAGRTVRRARFERHAMTTATKPRPKPMKLGERRTYEVEGVSVILHKVEVELRYFSSSYPPTRVQKSRYEILVDEVFYGHIQLPSGVDTVWVIEAVGKTTRFAYDFEMQAPWDAFPSPALSWSERKKFDRDTLVLHVPRLIREGVLITQEAMNARVRAKKASDAKRKAEEERSGRETRARMKAEGEAARTGRIDRLEVLEGLLKRLQPQMTNVEADAFITQLEGLRAQVRTDKAWQEAFGDKDEG